MNNSKTYLVTYSERSHFGSDGAADRSECQLMRQPALMGRIYLPQNVF